MIPKIIHYCWFGRNPLPPLAIKCIESWKKYLPDYEIKEWNEDNFDVNAIAYTKEAYEAKKYAFVSDYARFWILYNYGGIYFDTDVEVIKPINDIVAKGSFIGRERTSIDGDTPAEIGINPGLGCGALPGQVFLKEMLDEYQDRHFIIDGSQNLKTIVEYTSARFISKGYINNESIQYCAGFYIYPKEYFCPLSMDGLILSKTSNTRTIHHYMASWGGGNFNRIWKIIKSRILIPILPKQIVQKIVSYKSKKRQSNS